MHFPFRTPSEPSCPSNRQFKASQVTALCCLPPPVPVRSLLAPAVQSSPPPRASTGDVHQSSSVDAGGSRGISCCCCCCCRGVFTLLLLFLLSPCNTQLLQPWWGIFVNEQDGAKKVSHDSHSGGGLDESWGRHLSGWRLVSPARDRRREEKREGDGSSARHVTEQQQPSRLGLWKMWTERSRDMGQVPGGGADRFFSIAGRFQDRM